jgi:hypothetical protein
MKKKLGRKAGLSRLTHPSHLESGKNGCLPGVLFFGKCLFDGAHHGDIIGLCFGFEPS